MQLTPVQFNQIEELRNHPAVSYVSIVFHKSGNTLVSVCSTLDADFNTVDKLVDDVFPTMTYRCKAYVSFEEEVMREMYVIDDDETGVEIHIHMMKTVEGVN